MAVAVSALTLALLLATSSDYAMVWDEGHTVRRERRLEEWIAFCLGRPGFYMGSTPFSEDALKFYWPFGREEPDGHPPLYAIVGLAGWYATHTWLAPLTSYRFGPMLLFAITVGMLFRHLALRYGRLAAVVGAGSLVLVPRLFSHAHYAHYDMPTTCWWLLAMIAFANRERSKASMLLFGVCWGAAAGTKFTGCFAGLAPLAFVAVVEWLPNLKRLFMRGLDPRPPDWSGTRTWLGGAVIAGVVVFAIQPAWWFHPIDSMRRFLDSNLTRELTQPIPVLYWGEVHRFGLPWHNTIVLTAITIPALTVLAGLAGIASAIMRRREDAEPLLWVCSWLALMVVRALPSAPGHDGIRLILPSIASLCVLAGIGAGRIAEILSLRGVRFAAPLTAALILGESLLGIAQLYPYTLSYYNYAIGGLKGAERFGFELTYYYDTLGPEFKEYLRKRPSLELRFPSDLVNTPFLREWGEWPDSIRIVGLEETKSPEYVLQRRRGLYYPYDSWLDKNGRSCFVVSRQGVDLLRVYTFAESLRAYERTKHLPTPDHLREPAGRR